MLRVGNLRVPLQTGADEAAIAAALRVVRLPQGAAEAYIAKKSVDARDKRDVHFVYAVDILLPDGEDALLRCLRPGVAALVRPAPPLAPQRAAPRAVPPVVVGMGPCGLFAALYLARAGLNPVCLERGEAIEARAVTVERFFGGGALDTESNVQFGEGGAGAFSDGKLTTGIKDLRCRQVLEELNAHGAPASVLRLAHPHIGTDYLPGVVASIRREIIALGGRVLHGAKLTGLAISHGRVTAARFLQGGLESELPASQVILAIGHSARDTLQTLFDAGLHMRQKPFSVGVRIEHRQEMIDRAQYGAFAGHPALGAAEYKLHCRLSNGRGAYTFCMCPGGRVILAASQHGGVCVNGMSAYARDGENANAALLVDVRTEDFPDTHPLSGLALQRAWERSAFRAGGGDYRAPAQRLGDFLAGGASASLEGAVRPTCLPGVAPANLSQVLPSFASEGLRAAIRRFDGQLCGFASPDAILTGVEARSSSPVRIPRGDTLEANIAGLYPAGEGAGYAGGIMSAAVDGLRTAQAVAQSDES